MLRTISEQQVNKFFLAGFGTIISLLGIIIILAYFRLEQIERLNEELYSKHLRNVIDIANLRANLNAERLDLSIILRKDRKDWGPWEKDLSDRIHRNRDIISRLPAGLGDGAEKLQLFDEFLREYRSFVELRNKELVLINEGKRSEARRLFEGPQLARHLRVRELLRAIERIETSESFVQINAVKARSKRYTLFFAIFGFAAILVSILLAFVLKKTISNYLAQRKRAEKALAQSEQEIRKRFAEIEQIYKYSPVGLFTLDRENRVVRINERMAELLGFPGGVNIGKSIWEILPEMAGGLIEAYRPVFERGEPVLNVEVHGRTPKEPSVYLYGIASFFPLKSGTGEVIGLTGSVLDITERKKAEKELLESERELKEAQRLAHVGSWEWDQRTDTVTWSEEFYRIAGRDPGEHAPNYYIEHTNLYTPESLERLRTLVERALKTGEPYKLELELIRPDRTTRWIEATGELKRDETGAITGLRGVVVDITERKLAAEELEKARHELERSNRDLQGFAYIASHDLKEPLRMIHGFIQLLAKKYSGKLDAEADEFIRFILEGAMRMERMIDDLLEYSRVQTQAKPFQRTDIDAILDQALENLDAAIRESNASITRDALPKAYADPIQLARVFQNLVANAIKFTRPGEKPRVRISSKDLGKEWLFSVSDNGIGIEPRDFGKLFQLFQRLHGKEYPGTGIGLAICKRIIERHGGRIWATSEPGKGTAFYFTIPKRS